MMTSKRFVKHFLFFNFPLLFLIGGFNFYIDAKSFHHNLGEKGFFPRTTEDSVLSKLHYLSNNKLNTIYFGSSRTWVGLPPNPLLIGDKDISVYNAGLSGMSFGQMVPFIKHCVALSQPRQVIIGVDFFSFIPTDTVGNTDLDLSLLTSNYLTYLIKRNISEFSKSISFYSIDSSIKSLNAFYNGVPYDGTQDNFSFQGQRTEAKMYSRIEDKGKGYEAFRMTINEVSKQGFAQSGDDDSIYKFNNLVSLLCEKKISTKIYIHPVHALLTDILRQKGLWLRLEQWKAELAKIASFYQDKQCAINILDFSGYNSITTESLKNLSESKTLQYYWEASHYKSEVGELILKRFFSKDNSNIPQDFGRELRQDTVNNVLTAIRKEQAQYLVSHNQDIQLAQKWVLAEKY